jgi:hypothetical protein
MQQLSEHHSQMSVKTELYLFVSYASGIEVYHTTTNIKVYRIRLVWMLKAEISRHAMSEEIELGRSAFTSGSACTIRGKARQLNLQHHSHKSLYARLPHKLRLPGGILTFIAELGWTTNCKFHTVYGACTNTCYYATGTGSYV